MIIKGGLVFQEDKTFAKKDLYVEKGRIAADSSQVTDDVVIDATDLYVLPGLIDIHSHGAVGHDFSDNDLIGLEEILKYEYARGITSYCPTSMTLEPENLKEIFSSMKNWRNRKGMSRIVGFNMEGPFLDPSKKGAHREECIFPPDADFFRECNASCGNLIRLVTLAPNMPGALDFIRELKEETVISLGHTSSDYETAKEAFENGASHVTHLFNAMNPLSHRAPGLIGAAAEREDCYAELICDGIHIHESMVRSAFSLFPGRIVLISDSMRATGMADGTYDLGGQQVTVNGRLATLDNGTIAGSVTDVFDGMRNAVSFGISLEEAVAAATMNPAKSIGIYDETGSLTPGKRADILLVDRELQINKIL
ncbi:MAG: N-acetylglucosamine-6-phosphate deacetylase [Lachnospiraceae bacterium]|nr:N-acetylglucosamine-6-phosphate deacetylase [Lachnospiraceae bacterium]